MKKDVGEMNMKMRWGLLNRGAKRGNAKERGKEKTPTPTHLARSGQTLKGKGKEKRRPMETDQDQRRGGKTDAPEPTYHGET